MTRFLPVALAAAGALLGTAGAQAKAPPDGVQICGADGACLQVDRSVAEDEWSLWGTAGYATEPAAVSRFYLVRWHWPNQPEQIAYYVPAAGKVRQLDDRGRGLWFDLHDPRTLRNETAALVGFAAPHVARVTVGGRPVRDPQSYLRLFGKGRQDWPVTEPRWLRISFAPATANPLTDEATDVRVSRRGGYLLIDGATVRIPLQLAQRIRRGASLRG
jgi:hypothetical protein